MQSLAIISDVHDAGAWATVIAVVVAGLLTALRYYGVIRWPRAAAERLELQANAEQLWRSEAEAARARADRLDAELTSLRQRMDAMMHRYEAQLEELRVEIAALRARPDQGVVLQRMDAYAKEILALIALSTAHHKETP